MAWYGWVMLDGSEVINGPRTEAYAASAGLDWFKPYFKNDDLAPLLGDEAYNTPLLDDAPWVDPDIPDSLDFYGFYPLNIAGIEDSTRQSTVTESTRDGGVPGRLRHATRTVVFNGALLAGTEAAAEYGIQWLKKVLIAGPCGGGAQENCEGSDLCYLASEPSLDWAGGSLSDYEITECLNPYRRTLRKFVVNNGPTVTAKKITTQGGQAWTVQFTGVAGTPWEFSQEIPIIEGFMDPAVADPFVSGVDGTFDGVGEIYVETECEAQIWEPIYDPLCPAMVPPPSPPDIPLGCYTAPVSWFRRQITIPKESVPLWGSVLPVVSVHARDADLRDLRLRFYSDPYDETYFSPYLYEWEGTPNASASNEIIAATGAVNRQNLSKNPGAEVDLGWASNSGAVYTRTVDATVKRSGAQSIRFTRTASSPSSAFASVNSVGGTTTFTAAGEAPVVVGQTYAATMYALPSHLGYNGAISLNFKDAAHAAVGSVAIGVETLDSVTEWTEISVTAVAPAGAATVNIGFNSSALVGNATTGHYINIDDSILTTGTTTGGYFDGDTTPPTTTLPSDPCAYCGDIVISYVPQDSTLVFDAASEIIYIQDPGGVQRRADSLVFRTDGKPFDWPSLTCGFGYVVAFDLPQTQPPPVVDLALTARSV